MVTAYLWLHGSVPMATEISPSYCLFSSEYYQTWSKQILTLEGHFPSFVGAAEQSSMESEVCFTLEAVDETLKLQLVEEKTGTSPVQCNKTQYDKHINVTYLVLFVVRQFVFPKNTNKLSKYAHICICRLHIRYANLTQIHTTFVYRKYLNLKSA